MGTYEAELAKIVSGRQELANAEKLLDLPVTVYPEVISMQKDMKGLRQIYGVYKAQKVRCGSTLGHITHNSCQQGFSSISCVCPYIF